MSGHLQHKVYSMHSPGPWKIVRASEFTGEPEDTKIHYIEAADGTHVYYTDGGYFEPKEEDAAAVEAIPDLVATLRGIVTYLHDHKSLPQGNPLHMNAAALLARLEEAKVAI